MLEQLKKEVLQANLSLQKNGLVVLTWGNASGIDREKGLVVIKPSGISYDHMKAQDMVILDLEGNVVEGALTPSSDAPTHLELYKKFPEIGGVVHTHSTYATAFAQAHLSIPALGTTHADHFCGDIPCTPDMTKDEILHAYEKNTGKVIVRTFSDKDPMKIPAVLVASHGVFTWGKNAASAAESALVVEKTAEMAYLSLTVAKKQEISKDLLDRHFMRKHGANAYYGQKKKASVQGADFTELLKEHACNCGRVHRSEVKKIVMYPGALTELPQVMQEMGVFCQPVIICDENTYTAAGKEVEKLVPLAKTVMLSSQGLHANEHSTQEVLSRLPDKKDILIAVGSGTIHDITRYVAYKIGIPFISVPTAASVDGYVSNVAAMTWRGAKKTLTACSPLAMVADIAIIARAPMRLTASGVGDMLGKYTALADWKLSALLTGEYYCERIASLVEKALEKVKSSAASLASGDLNAVTSLMYGLVLSGVAMQHTGISRPASGAEHHISHLIEMTVSTDKCDAYHGEKVGVGLILASRLYHEFANKSDQEIRNRFTGYLKPTDAYITEKFGTLAEEIQKENEKDCAACITKEKFFDVLQEIKKIIAEIPNPDVLEGYLDTCNACKSLGDIGLSEKELLPSIFLMAPLVRNRLTLMRILAGFNWTKSF